MKRSEGREKDKGDRERKTDPESRDSDRKGKGEKERKKIIIEHVFIFHLQMSMAGSCYTTVQ